MVADGLVTKETRSFLNIKTVFPWYRDSCVNDTGKTTSLYWDDPQVVCSHGIVQVILEYYSFNMIDLKKTYDTKVVYNIKTMNKSAYVCFSLHSICLALKSNVSLICHVTSPF